MLVRGTLALAVVAAGVALGMVLGAFADPRMKGVSEPAWRGALQAPYSADDGYALAEPQPQDLSPYRDSYAPSWAAEELADWEPDYPEWTYSTFAEEPDAAGEEQPAEVELADLEPPSTDAAPEPVAAEPRIAGVLDALY